MSGIWGTGFREGALGALGGKWDLVIVGGGITGAGILAEATRLGMRTLLLEGKDFASGTSSRSTKLVHGGLRYLRNLQFRLTHESVVERERLLEEAPGLVDPLSFCIASFERDKTPGWVFGAGLAIYDLFALKWAHEELSIRRMVERLPPLEGTPLLGGYRYFDAQTDDARLVLRVLREGVRRGGVALNYTPVISLLRDAKKSVRGVVARDDAGGEGRTFEIEARAVINATGAWADDLRKHVGQAPKLRGIRGSHLGFSRERLPIREAVTMLHPDDGRAVFAVPWEGITLVGTTDVDHKAGLDEEPAASADEAEYILRAAQRAFPSLELSMRDVRSSWSGVRGVVNTGAADPSKESREHALWTEDGLLTVTGGKLTTFRVMAREALAALGSRLPRRPSHDARILDEVASATRAIAASDLDLAVHARVLGRHGADAPRVAACAEEPWERGAVPGTTTLWCELRWAARDEGVVHLDDLLLRRVRLGMLLERGGVPQLARVRGLVQRELGWDDAKWDAEVARYEALWARAYGTTFE